MNVSEKLKDLFNKFESGELRSLADLQTPAEKSLFEKASLVRNFDKNLYTKLLSSPADEEIISFEQFTRHSDIERVPRTDNVFRVKENIQQKYLIDWRNDFSKQQIKDDSFLKKLIKYYENETSQDELDLLGLKVLTDPAGAKEIFLNLYEKADSEFDLAGCNDLLRILEERHTLLRSDVPAENELLNLYKQKRQYLKSRSLYSADYYQTAFCYTRDQIVRAFNNLLNEKQKSNSKWIFHLYATGGMGKTMFVRWLIARHFIPEPRRIPVARIDFDFLHLPTVTAHPWLLFLVIAEQLNQQIEGSPFSESLSSFAKYGVLVRPPKENLNDPQRTAIEKELTERVRQTAVAEVIKDFIKTLKKVNEEKPFIIVLDTLERLVLHYKDELIIILNQFALLQNEYKQTRLLLAGRYNLLDRLPSFKTQFQAQTVVHELTGFTNREAQTYLEKNRKLTDKKIVKAITKRCERDKTSGNTEVAGSNPFKLSLVTDFYQQKIVETANDITTLERLDIEYLISRIITHIKEPTVQWLLRYAVIPRRFTFDIFKEVLAPRLKEEMLNNGKLDQPNKNFPKGATKFEDQKIWKELESDQYDSLDHQKIWDALINYASSSSYISFDTGDETTPQLHSDVVIPMRVLLESQEPIFKVLHQDAAAYFQKKSADETNLKLWTQFTCEEIYHHFQKDGAAAANIWREKFNEPLSRNNPEVRRIIAEEITGKDYVNEETKLPIKRADGKNIVDQIDLYEAHFRAIEALYSLITIAPRQEVSSLWVRLNEHFTDLFRLRTTKTELSPDYEKPFDETILRRLTKKLSKPRKDFAALISLLREAIKSTRSQQIIISLEIILGDFLNHINDAEALDHFQIALELISRSDRHPIQMINVYLKIGNWYQARKDFVRSEEIYLKLIEMGRKENVPTAVNKGLRELVGLNRELGLYNKSVNLLNQILPVIPGDEEGQMGDALNLSLIQARNFYDPLKALNTINPFLSLKHTPSQRAALHQVYGDLQTMLLQFNEASGRIETAHELWNSVSNFVGADRTRILRLNFEFFGRGDYTRVTSLFDDWDRKAAKDNSELNCQVEIYRVLFEFRNERHIAARTIWQKLLKNKGFRQMSACSVRILAIGLALGFGGDSVAEELITELKKITPITARLPLLDFFQFALFPLKINAQNQEALINLIDVKSVERNLIPHSLIRADVIDCCDETAAAEKILRVAAEQARKDGNTYAYREILLACDRLGTKPSTDLIETDYLILFCNDFAAFPNLCAAACLEQAERFLKLGKSTECHQLLASAQEYLRREKGFTHQLEAKLNELFGRVAEIDDNIDVARSCFNVALSIYKKLGNKAAAKEMQELVPLSEKSSQRKQTFSIKMETTAKTFSVETYSERHLKNQHRFSLSNQDLFLKIITAQTNDIESIYQFSELYDSNPQFVEDEMKKILFSEYLSGKLKNNYQSGSLPNLHLESLAPSFAKIPWELAFHQKDRLTEKIEYFYRSASHEIDNTENFETTKWLQTALSHLTGQNIYVDGVFGLQTEAMLSAFKDKLNLPENLIGEKLYSYIGKKLSHQKSSQRTRVLIIAPHLQQQIRATRMTGLSGATIERIYKSAEFTTEILWGSELERLRDLLAIYQPDILHIFSSYRLMPSVGQIYLDFGVESNFPAQSHSLSSFSSESVQPSTAFINDALALLPETKFRPLIILDALCPSDPLETIRQLLYRNAFAAELFQYGNASGIIGSGLCANPLMQELLTKSMITFLSETRSFGATVNELKKLLPDKPNDMETAIAGGIALFTNEPLLTVISSK